MLRSLRAAHTRVHRCLLTSVNSGMSLPARVSLRRCAWRRARAPGGQRARVSPVSSVNMRKALVLLAAFAQCSALKFHVAPLQCYTNQHLRALLRPLSPGAVLWTEMEKVEKVDAPVLAAPALRSPDEKGPLVLQLGGNDPRALAQAVRTTARGFDEVNLNAGCPSVETGGASFGASLMLDPHHTRTLVDAMSDAAGAAVRRTPPNPNRT